jgi:peptidoglycan hydrolase-like protein with peptidoglycan-binding domain
MYGSVPAYRTLKSSVSDGPDVAELNQNLIDLGYDPSGAITDDNHFGEATAAAVRRWQKAEGLSETGEVELGRIVFAPGARRVTSVHVSVGQDPPGEPGPTGPSAAASNRPAAKGAESEKPASKAPESEKPASKEPKSKEPKAEEPKSKEPSSKKPKSEEPKSKEPKSEEPKSKEPKSKEPESKEPESKDPGSGNGGEVVLTTTSTQQLVQLKVKPEQQQLARVGESAPVSLPGGRTDSGRIIEVGSVATESEKGGGGGGGGGGGEGESATITVTLALDRPVAHLDQAPVSVELVKSVRHGVLTVPATSLTATGGGGYAIQVLEGGRRAELPVTPGMFANGYVQVEGGGLHEGQTVVEAG